MLQDTQSRRERKRIQLHKSAHNPKSLDQRLQSVSMERADNRCISDSGDAKTCQTTHVSSPYYFIRYLNQYGCNVHMMKGCCAMFSAYTRD